MESDPNPLSMNDALVQIADIEQRAWAEGAIDVEPNFFNSLRENLKSGVLTPLQALEKALYMASGRSNYH